MYYPYYLPEYGGAELATLNLTREISRLCDVKVYTFNYKDSKHENAKYGLNVSDEYPEYEDVDNIKIYRFPITYLPIIKNFSLRLIFALKTVNADIIHFQGAPRLFGRLLIQFLLRGKKTVLTTHGFIESLKILDNSKFSFLPQFFFKKSLTKMDHIIALSTVDVKFLRNLGVEKEKIALIPNGIDIQKFQKRKEFVERSEKKKILCVARFSENKNYEALVNALFKLRQDMDFEAYFIGAVTDKKYYDKILRLIKTLDLEENIRIEISLEDEYLVDCYLSCDLFVLPSKMETFPLVILEAMYAGLPVISTPVGGIPNIIKNDVNGFLVNPNDHEMLYKKCLQVLKDENLMRKMGETNMEASKDYTWKNSADLTYKLYMKILNRD
jgi:glycosyltransferase involved in cell wall biosynthesis